MLRTVMALTVITSSAVSTAAAEPIRSQSSKVWFSHSECWATVLPVLQPFIEDFGMSKIVENSPDRIEHKIIDVISGRTVMRFGCIRVPDTPTFRRYFEVP
jgi:hypothetical protein